MHWQTNTCLVSFIGVYVVILNYSWKELVEVDSHVYNFPVYVALAMDSLVTDLEHIINIVTDDKG